MSRLKDWLFAVEDSVNPFYFAGRALVWGGAYLLRLQYKNLDRI